MKQKPTLLLDTLDTVRPNGTWDSDPFTPIVKEGKLFGLGSNDTGEVLSRCWQFLLNWHPEFAV